ncbi:type II toxin-antitoxin system VapC family toxin [Sphingomonas sp. 8AM]|uniref:type II toxin-antitoxin system VapC family toxin n=1 Tax=Sphingomonas sp. 8AM TaxID=2653170 RepID=UPI0012F46545|nr:type II toxin-antitoxin system VapC family toxin [Sphingomonas sp. 8AM]VXC64964.1 PIN domain nuclease [Sphingomonas sp. 8AM]
MRLLLDTHALLWWWFDDATLPDRAKAAIGDRANEVHVSAASGWEIATKIRKGHLLGLADRMANFERYLADDGFRALSITMAHGVRSGALPGAHKDPFDRMLAAQALIEDLTLVTCDRVMTDFGCETFW